VLAKAAVVPAGLQRQHVGLGDVGLASELLADEGLAVLEFAAVHPRQKAEREHVLGALPVLLRGADRFDRAERQRRHRDGLNDVVGKLVGLERIGLVADLREVALGELVGVGDHQAAAGQVGDVGLQRCRVHRDEDIGTVACGQDVVVGDLDLERRDAGQSACWCPDLGGVIGLCGKVIAEQGGLGGEPVAGQLHAVARVACEPNDNFFELLASRRTGPAAVRAHNPCLSCGSDVYLRRGSASTILVSLAVPIKPLLLGSLLPDSRVTCR
jgi:hypothetical protein